MEAIILAGGFGTRLQSVVSDVPKPMAPVAGRPFLDIVLTSLANGGFKRVVLSLGYLSEKIVDHFGTEFNGIELAYVIEDKPLGTGGAIRLAMDQCQSDHVYIFNGDTYLDLEIDALEAMWQKHQQPIIVSREVPDTARYGRLQVESNQVTDFLEKGVVGPGLINAGTYVFPRQLLNQFTVGQPFSIEADFLSPTVKEQQVLTFISKGHFIDIGIPEDYARAQIELKDI